MTDHFEHDITLALTRRAADRPDIGCWHQRLVDTRDMPRVHPVTLTVGELRELIFGWRDDIRFAEQMAQWATDNAARAAQFQQWWADVQHDFTHTKHRLYDRIEELEQQLAAAHGKAGAA